MRGGEPELELSTVRVRERVGRRERVWFKCRGAQNHQLGLDRSDRSPIPVRPVRAELVQADRRSSSF